MSEMEMNKQDEIAKLKAMFKGFTEKPAGEDKIKKEDLLKKYFSVRNNTEVFRPLPPLKGRKAIEEAFFHRVKVNGSGGNKQYATLYCPAHNDLKIHKLDENGNPMYDGTKPVLVHAPCPLCDKYNEILSKQDNSVLGKKDEDLNAVERSVKEKNKEIYKEAVQWKADKYYIIKGIDKGAIKDGPKFWRFKHNYKNQGILDKITPMMSAYMEMNSVPYYDVDKGADFTIISTDSEFGKIKYKSVVSILTHQQPLHTDPLVAKNWTDDNTIWRDVFKPRKAPNINNEQYLQMVANGIDPYFDESDQNNKKWVFPGNPELENLANTRNMNLDNGASAPIEQASDLREPAQARTPEITIETNVAQPVIETPVSTPVIETPVSTPVVETPITTTPVAETPVSTPVVETPTAFGYQDGSDEDYSELPF